MNKTAKIAVGGMMCPKCAARIERALLKVAGVKAADADAKSQTVSIETADAGDDLQEEIKEAVEGAGYEFCGIVGEEH